MKNIFLFDKKIRKGIHGKEQNSHIFSQKLTHIYKVFLVAGGYGGSGLISSTETLVEGDQGWNDQKPLPSGRSGLRGLSLPDTVIMTGNQVHTFFYIYQIQRNRVLKDLELGRGGKSLHMRLKT